MPEKKTKLPWQPAPSEAFLHAGDAHLWRMSLACGPAVLEQFWETLSEDECDRASRFRFEKDRSRYVAARGALRAILSRYTATAPADFRFDYSLQGKPSLAKPAHFPVPEFNLAHSRDLAVFAVTQGRAVGVDLEAVDETFPVLDVAPDIFTDEELQSLESMAERKRHDAFFKLWTCKEALLKARGDGFSADPKSVNIAWEKQTPRLRAFEPETAAWSLRVFDVADGYAAALAMREKIERVSFFQITPAHAARACSLSS